MFTPLTVRGEKDPLHLTLAPQEVSLWTGTHSFPEWSHCLSVAPCRMRICNSNCHSVVAGRGRPGPQRPVLDPVAGEGRMCWAVWGRQSTLTQDLLAPGLGETASPSLMTQGVVQANMGRDQRIQQAVGRRSLRHLSALPHSLRSAVLPDGDLLAGAAGRSAANGVVPGGGGGHSFSRWEWNRKLASQCQPYIEAAA